MTFDAFLAAIKAAGIKQPSYLPFTAEKVFLYPPRHSRRSWSDPIDPPPFIAQYWDAGGVSGGSCWDSSDPQPYDGDAPPTTFPELVKVLHATVPNLTFLQYQMLEATGVIKTGEETQYEYYGNHTTYGYRIVVLRDLYDKLVEMGAISS